MEPALQDEKALLADIAAGSEMAFACLFQAYRNRLYNNLFTITESREMAEDAVHEVFLKIWMHREWLT